MRRAVQVLLVSSILPASLLAASSADTSSVASSTKTTEIKAGNELFLTHCMQCHAVIETQSSFGPNLHEVMKKPHGKKSVAEIKQILENGKGKMPSFKNKLSEQDENALIAYIRTL